MASTRGFDPVRSLENRGRNLCGVTAVQRGEIGDRAQDQGTRTKERKTGGDSRWLLPGDLTPCAAWKTGAGTSAESPPETERFPGNQGWRMHPCSDAGRAGGHWLACWEPCSGRLRQARPCPRLL